MLTSFGVAAVSSLRCGAVEFLAQRTRRAPRRVGSATPVNMQMRSNLNCGLITLCALPSRSSASPGLIQDLLGGDVMNPAPGTLPGRPRLLRSTLGSEHSFHRHLGGEGVQQSGHLCRRTAVHKRPNRWRCGNHHSRVDLCDVIDQGMKGRTRPLSGFGTERSERRSCDR